jgi:hypothetical protein
MKNRRSVSAKFFALALIILAQSNCFAQHVNELLTLYFNEVKGGKYPAIPKQISLPENAPETLIAIKPFLNDTLAPVRAKAYAIAQLAGYNSRVPSIRLVFVNHIVSACKDNDSGNVGLALSYLTKFRREDFTPAAMDSIRKLVRKKIPHFDQLLKLAGFLELRDLKEEIRVYSKSGNPENIRWAAILSLARMGDEASHSDMMARIRKLPMNDNLVYEIFPDMVYTRHRDAINYLVEVLQSDTKNCMSADPEREVPIVCGYRVMEQLAPAIEGYPLKVDGSGDIKTDNYPAALNTVREWFNKNKEYKINRGSF